MSIHRRAAKKDRNHNGLVVALKARGWTVTSVSAPGFPDAIAVRRGVIQPIEFKMPDGCMEPAQVDLHEEWERSGVRIPVICDEDDIERLDDADWPEWLGTYRDFPWRGVSSKEKARRLATVPGLTPIPGTPQQAPRQAPRGRKIES